MSGDKDKQREYSRRWYERNRGRHRAATRRYYIENREDILGRERRRYRASPESVIARARKNYLRRKYGLSPEDYAALVISHSGRCGICGAAPDGGALRIDHDHATGHLRGLLCSSCNIGLGHFRDDPTRLAAAINYLEEG